MSLGSTLPRSPMGVTCYFGAGVVASGFEVESFCGIPLAGFSWVEFD